MDRAMEVKIWVLALALNCGWLAQGSAYLMSNRKVALRFLPVVDLYSCNHALLVWGGLLESSSLDYYSSLKVSKLFLRSIFPISS